MSFEPYASAHISKLSPYEPGKPIEETAREVGIAAANIIKLASNENPLGPSPRALEAMRVAATSVNLYPDGAATVLRSYMANYLSLTPNRIVIGNGSSELIELLAHICLGPETEAIAAEYCFALYPLVCRLLGSKLITIPNKPDYGHDLNATLEAITPRTRLIFIANPANPLGTMTNQADIISFIHRVPPHVLVVFDEAYIHFADQRPHTLRFVREGRNVCVLRTFSKAYGLAGLRIGCAATTPEIAELLNRVRSPFNTSSIAQAAAIAALEDRQHLECITQVVREGKQLFKDFFDENNIPFIPSQANFVLARVGDGQGLFRYCLNRGIILRPVDSYGLPEYIRITVGTHEQNKRCLQAIRDYLDITPR